SRGVDLALFQPGAKDGVRALATLARPILLYVGRVAVEKNIGAFLDLDAPGTKVVVGDGPQRAALERAHPNVIFTGAKHGTDLARHYAAADVFVFPSRTDTFGLVMLEALACGIPVAAFPVPGPLDVVGARGHGTVPGFTHGIGALDENLGHAVKRALAASPADCRRYALHYSWPACATRFVENLVWAADGSCVVSTGDARKVALG
ncbi:MAG: glycosyltransferase, partial [Alphaproteobacteria bacterium]